MVADKFCAVKEKTKLITLLPGREYNCSFLVDNIDSPESKIENKIQAVAPPDDWISQ